MTFPPERLTTPDPATERCEWCGDPAVTAIERRRKNGRGFSPTGQYIFACAKHEQTARQLAHNHT